MSIRSLARLISLGSALLCLGQASYYVQPFTPHGFAYPPPLLDTFNRANGALGTTWLSDMVNQAGFMGIVSNQATKSSGGDASSAWNTITVGPHQMACATVATLTGTTWVGVWVRVNNPDSASMDGYGLWWRSDAGTDQIEFGEWVSAARTQLGADILVEQADGDVLCLEANGSTLTAYINGVPQGTRTDATITDGDYIGLGTSGTAGVLDDFRGASE